METRIPFTKFKLQIKKTKGGSTCNGNGYKTKTLSFMIITQVGNGDDGNRCCTGDPKDFASIKISKK